jgi:hypothetical protein
MMRAPAEALQFRVGRHGWHLGVFRRHCEGSESPRRSSWIASLRAQ